MYKPILTFAVPTVFLFALFCATLVVAKASGL
jgi:hypothetical protein